MMQAHHRYEQTTSWQLAAVAKTAWDALELRIPVSTAISMLSGEVKTMLFST